MAKAGGWSLCSHFIFFFFFNFLSCRAHLACPESSATIPIPAGLIWPARRALPTIRLSLFGENGVPIPFDPLIREKLTGHCQIVSKNSMVDRVWSQIASAMVAGVQTSAVTVFLLDMCGVFFPKALKDTKLYSGGRDLSFGLRTPAFLRNR